MKKILALSLTEEQRALLTELMEASHATNKSAFVVGLLSAEKERRTKRPVGRPRKEGEDEEDEPRNIPNPNPMDVKDRPYLTESEWKWLYKDKPIPKRANV